MFSADVLDAVQPVIEAAFGGDGMASWQASLSSSAFDDPAQHAAVFIYGLAAHHAYLTERPGLPAVTGHSLGIYAAAVAAGVLSAGSAVRLILSAGAGIERAQRDRAMRLLVVTGLTEPRLHAMLDHGDRREEVRITHYHSSVQHLLSGREPTLRALASLCIERGALSATLLPFPGAVHRADLADFAGAFLELVDETEFRDPSTCFYSPVSGALVKTAGEARTTIRDQLIRPVRFTETILNMAAAGAGEFVVLGPCAQLMGIIGWIHRGARVILYPAGPGKAGRR